MPDSTPHFDLAMYTDDVDRGVALLDQKLGESWVHLIDLERLELSSTCNCVVGQLFDPNGELVKTIDLNEHMLELSYDEDDGQYILGLRYLGINHRDDEDDHEHGFQLRPGYEYRWAYLTEAWRQKIEQLRAERPGV